MAIDEGKDQFERWTIRGDFEKAAEMALEINSVFMIRPDSSEPLALTHSDRNVSFCHGPRWQIFHKIVRNIIEQCTISAIPSASGDSTIPSATQHLISNSKANTHALNDDNQDYSVILDKKSTSNGNFRVEDDSDALNLSDKDSAVGLFNH